MSLNDLICKLREEAEKTSATPNWLRIAADTIEHLKEERAEFVESNTTLQKYVSNLREELCFSQSRVPPTN